MMKAPTQNLRIARHKTTAKEPSLVYMTSDEDRVLDAYIQYYRPLAVPCSSSNCYAFASNTNQMGVDAQSSTSRVSGTL